MLRILARCLPPPSLGPVCPQQSAAHTYTASACLLPWLGLVHWACYHLPLPAATLIVHQTRYAETGHDTRCLTELGNAIAAAVDTLFS